MMTFEQAKTIVFDLVGQIDYDIQKSLDPKTAEDPEWAESELNRLAAVLWQKVKNTDSFVD